MERIICLIIGYICGLFQTSYIIGRMHKTDIRDYGSGNAGTTNALRTFGRKAGALTLLGDVLKCVIAVVLVNLIFGKTYGEIMPLLSVYAAAGCILGHNFPFYLNFRGGKGFAASVGFMLIFDYKIFFCLRRGVYCNLFPDALCVAGISERICDGSDRNDPARAGRSVRDGQKPCA